MPFLPILTATALAAVPAPSAEDRVLFAAFKGVCRNVRSLDAMARAARKGGWRAVHAEAHPNLAKLVNGGREALLKEDPDAVLAGAQYARTVGGRTLWLVTSRYANVGGYWANGCRVYHFDAVTPLPPSTLVALMGRPMSGTMPLPDGGTKLLWEPGWKSGHSVEVSFTTGADPISQKFGLKGQALTAHAIGRISK